MDLNQLLNQINTLSNTPIPPVEHLSERVINAYVHKTCSRLQELLTAPEEDKDRTQQLETFLKENWELVQGSLLSYTALPGHELTKLLVDCANYVIEEKNKKQTNANGTISIEPSALISILMPGVSTDSVHEDYSLTLVQKNHEEKTLTLGEILRTHILSRTKNYLIPVHLLSTMHSSFTEKSLYNPYFDYQSHEEHDAYINENDYQQLINHSHITRELVDTLTRYETLCNDTGSLLGHLRLLCRNLHFNSVNGIAQEENAGRGVYAAIIAFNDYYTKLGDAQNNVPTELQEEIQLLIKLSSNPESNINATETLDTCIATRCTQLEEKIKIHESLLGSIMLQGEQKKELIEQEKSHLESCQKHLSQQINAGTYMGSEKSMLTLELLAELDITFEINSKKDVEILKFLEPDELRSIFATQDMRQQWVNFLNTIEEVVLFFLDTRPDRLEALVSLCAKEISGRFILTPQDFSSLIIALDNDRKKIVMEGMKQILPKLIKGGHDASVVLEHLSSEQCTIIVLEFMQSRIHEFKEEYFSKILGVFPSERRLMIIETIQQILHERIKNGYDYYLVLELLSDNIIQRTRVFELMQPRMPEFIKNRSDFRWVFKSLAPKQCPLLIEAMQQRMPELIKNGEDLGEVLFDLSFEQCSILIEAMQQRMPELIKNGEDLGKLLKPLSLLKSIGVIIAMQQRISELIKNGEDLGLPPGQRTLVSNILCFQNLFDEIQQKSKKLDTSEANVVNELLDTLKRASTTYFICENKQDSYQQFKNTCTDAIDKAKRGLKNEVSWLKLFEKIMLVILSLGTVLLGSALNSQRETGKWRVRFFDSPMDSPMEKISDMFIKRECSSNCVTSLII